MKDTIVIIVICFCVTGLVVGGMIYTHDVAKEIGKYIVGFIQLCRKESKK